MWPPKYSQELTHMHTHEQTSYCKWQTNESLGTFIPRCRLWAKVALLPTLTLPFSRSPFLLVSFPGHSHSRSCGEKFSPQLWDKIWEWPGNEATVLSLTAHSLNIHSLGPSLRIMARYWNTAVTTSSTWSVQSDGTYTTHAWITPSWMSHSALALNQDLSHSFNCAAASFPGFWGCPHAETDWITTASFPGFWGCSQTETNHATLAAFPGHHHMHSKCDGNQRLGMRLALVTDLLPPPWGPWWH